MGGGDFPLNDILIPMHVQFNSQERKLCGGGGKPIHKAVRRGRCLPKLHSVGRMGEVPLPSATSGDHFNKSWQYLTNIGV